MRGTTRAGALLAFAGGLVGVGRLARGDRSLVVHAREPAAASDRVTLVAELVDERGERLGELYGAGFALNAPGERWADGADRLELHTFRLPGGTIVGTGAAPLDEGEFAVVGGTGRYAGARGSYTARRAAEGTEYVFDLRV